MKNNLVLLGILIALLIGTYFFYEKPHHDHVHTYEHQHVVEIEDVTSISFNDVNAQLKDLQWKSGDSLLSHNQMKKILDVLSHVAVIREIEGAVTEDDFFKNRMDLSVNGESWSIGDFNLDQTSYYFKRNGKLYLATFEGEADEILREDENPYVKKMNLFRDLLSENLQSLKETQLFRYYPRLPVGLVTIKSEGRPAYSLDLVKNTTEPNPLPGIEIHKNLLSKFYPFLTQINIKEEVSYPLPYKGVSLGRLTFLKDDDKTEWQIILKSKSSADAYLVDDQNKRAFQMVGGTLKILFLSVQDFWDKKVIHPNEFKSFEKLPLNIIQGEKEAQVNILNREPLEFESKKFKVDAINMNKILHLIFNLSNFDQADRVSPLSETEKKIVQNESLLTLKIFGQELLLWKKTQEIIVVNLTQGLKFHYFNTDESFPIKFEDVLK